MILGTPSATIFINAYKTLLLEIDGYPRRRTKVVEALVSARAKMVADPALADAALARLNARSERLDVEAVEAAKGVQVEQWVYLRDTRTHSIFIEPSGDAAYGVVGLTDRIRDIIGASGVVIETGVMRYKNRFVCDGLFSNVVWLGPNYMRSFRDVLTDLRSKGCFRVQY